MHNLWQSLIKYQVSPNLIYFLDCCRNRIKPSDLVDQYALREEAIKRKLLNEADNQLTIKALTILEEFEGLITKGKKKVEKEVLGEDFINKVNQYRNIFPAKRLPSNELARQSVQELTTKFVWFFKTFPEYNWEIVLDAADYYVYVKEKENYQYMVTSSYFISKTDPRTRVWKSLLADHCQMITENPDLLSGI